MWLSRVSLCLLLGLPGVLAPGQALSRGPQPPAPNACPGGFFSGFVAGTDQYLVGRRLCAAIAVDPRGRALADRATCDGEWPLPAAPAAPEPRLSARISQDRGARSWTVMTVQLGGRRLITWRSYYPLHCAGQLYLSPDRYVIAVELVRSKDYQPSGEHEREVVAFRLPRPLP